MMNLNLKEDNSLLKILAVLLLVYSGVNLLMSIGYNNNFLYWINILSFGAVGVILLVKNVDRKYISIPLGISALIYLYYFLSSFGMYYGIFINAICNLLMFAAIGGIAFYTLKLWKLDFLKKFDFSILSRFWFVPTICYGVSFLINLIGSMFLFRFGMRYGFINFILNVLFAVILLLLGKCFMYDAKMKKTTGTNKGVNSSNNVSTSMSEEDDFCDMAKHVLLLLFTFGIWNYIWIYRITKYLNNTPGEEYRNPTNKLLLCIFVPFYYIYWVYQSARRIDILARSKGIESDIATLSLIMALFVPIVAPIVMQSKINQICTFNGSNANRNISNNNVNVGAADELKKYKELLDDGAITKEEYDAKKKQLLGL